MSVPKGAKAMQPCKVSDKDNGWILAVTTEGHALAVTLGEFPVLPKGKGIKVINIPSKKAQAREEVMSAFVCFGSEDAVRLFSGEKQKVLTSKELDAYVGERGLRGLKLPKGYRTVERIEVVKPEEPKT